MHVGGTSSDLNWYVRLIVSVLSVVVGLSFAVKKVASKYFEVDANFEGNNGGGGDLRNNHAMTEKLLHPLEAEDYICANCVNPGTKKCSRCKSVRYCSTRCQVAHWNSGHKSECKDFGKVNSALTASRNAGLKASAGGGRRFSGIALVPPTGKLKPITKPRKVLFPYEEFIKLYNSDKPAFAPCGLLNCGNSCFANVVLQCLTYTRPLFAFLLQSGHQRECRRNDWCFLCVFQGHVERASQSSLPFSPMNILSRLPNIGGNLGYGRQEDAHEFMRFAIDTMQSVCLDEFGGEKAVDLATQETTIIQHIFGGHLQSQVICAKCNKTSNQLENMMDLTVEIHGDGVSLEECLDQFTDKETLHGDNMYKCDGCNDYVKAWKRLTIRRAPNILTIALKRFQSGRFGKLNKRVTFPETLDLSPYMSEEGDGSDVYKLYAVVVHVDMLNASFFGHYICYTKDFHGNWYRIDDCKVASAELEEVLSQGAYMLLYSRVSVRPSCLRDDESSKKEQEQMVKMELDSCTEERVESSSALEPTEALSTSGSVVSEDHSEVVSERLEGVVVNLESTSAVSNGVSSHENGSCSGVDSEDMMDAVQRFGHQLCSSAIDDPDSTCAVDSDSSSSALIGDSGNVKDSCGAVDSKAIVVEYSNNGELSKAAIVKDVKVNGSAHSHSYTGESISSKSHNLKRESPVCDLDDTNGHEAKKAEIATSNSDS